MTIHVQGIFGFASDAVRAKAEGAFLKATAMPATSARAEAEVLSLAGEAPDEAYPSIRSALADLSGAATGGHVDLRAPGHGTSRCFGGDAPWGFRSEPIPEQARVRLGSVAFHFDGGVGRLAFGPRGELAVGGMLYARGRVAVFDALGAELLYAWAHDRPEDYHGDETVAVTLSPSGERVVSGSCDRRAVVREVRSGRPLATLKHPEEILDIAWVDETIITAGERSLVLWDAGRTFKKRASLDLDDARILGQASGTVFLYLGRQSLARLDPASGEIRETAPVGGGVVAVAPDGRHAVAVEKAGKISKAVTMGGGPRKITVKLEAPPAALGFAADGTLVAALEAGQVLVITPAGEIAERYLVADKLWSSLTRLATAADGRVALATRDRCPIVIDRARQTIACSPDSIASVIPSPVDSSFVLLGQRPRWVDPGAGTERLLPGARHAAFSVDGAVLAIHDGTSLRLLESTTLAERVARKTPSIESLILSPDATALATTGRDLALFDVASGKTRRLGKKGERASTAAFSPDGQTLAAARSAAIDLLEVATGKLAATLSCEPLEVYHLAFSPDGQRLVAASGKEVVGFDLATRERIFMVERGAGCLSWAPDGSTIAVGGWGEVTLLDGRDGTVKERLHGHLGSVESVAHAGDGSQLISVGEEGTALVFPRAAAPARKAPPTALVALSARAAAAGEQQKQKSAETSRARQAVQVEAPSRVDLVLACNEAMAPSPAIPRLPMRLRAHGTLVFPSREALDEGVRGFDENAYVEWYSAKDLVVADRTVTVDLETDLEVDCCHFGVSFQELSRRALAGVVRVAWDNQVTAMRFTRRWTPEPEVPVLPPAARARYGRMAAGLEGALVSDGEGAFAAASSTGVAILDVRGAVVRELPVPARLLLSMDATSIVALVNRGSDGADSRLERFDRKTGLAIRSTSISAAAALSRPAAGGHFVAYEENRAALWDLTPRMLGTVTLGEEAWIEDAVADGNGALVALATGKGLFLWTPSRDGAPARVSGAYAAVTLLAGGELVALGSPDPAAKDSNSLLTRIRPDGAVMETVKARKRLGRLRAKADGGLIGSHDYEGVLGCVGADLKKRWLIDATKKAGTLDAVSSLDGETLLAVSSGGALLGFDVATGARSTDHAYPLLAMDATADLLATLDASGDLIVRARRTGELRFRHRLAIKAEKSVHLVFAAPGLAVADSDRLVLVDVAGASVRELEKNKLTCAARTADGTLVTGHADGKLRLAGDSASPIQLRGDIRRIAVAARADRVACLLKDSTVVVVEGGSVKQTLKGSREFGTTLALSSDGRTLALARTQKERHATRGDVLLVDLDEGGERLVLSRANPGPCLFAPDGSRLFVADGRTIRTFDLASCSPLQTISGHGGDVRALALPGDGSLLSASDDHTSLEWDLAAVAADCGGLPKEEMGIPE